LKRLKRNIRKIETEQMVDRGCFITVDKGCYLRHVHTVQHIANANYVNFSKFIEI